MSQGAVIAVLGASSAVGHSFLRRTRAEPVQTIAVSRRPPAQAWPHATWLEHDLERGPVDVRAGALVSFGPLAHALSQVQQGVGLGRVVALNPADMLPAGHLHRRGARRQAAALQQCEDALIQTCRERNIVLTVLKPVSVYGNGPYCKAGDIRLPAGRFVPIGGRGLRAPVHADDLGRLAVSCLIAGSRSAGAWLLAGGETLPYPAALRRLAAAEGRRVRIVRLPAWLLNAALGGARLLGRKTTTSPAAIERQRIDLLVDDTPAREQLGWQPRPFRP